MYCCCVDIPTVCATLDGVTYASSFQIRPNGSCLFSETVMILSTEQA